MRSLHPNLFRLFFLALFIAMPAFAENRTVASRKPREVASLEEKTSQTYTRTKVKSAFSGKDKAFHAALGLIGGVSSVTSDGASSSSPLAGFVADFREYKYFGIDLEGYFAFPAKSGEDTTKFFGGSANIKGQLPLDLGGARFVPKLGAGYGLVRQVDFTAETEDASAGQDTVTIRGPYAIVGFEIEPFEDFILSADYRHGISLTANLESTADLSSGEIPLDNGRMETARVAIYYRVARQTLLGTQYSRRTVGYAVETESGTVSSTPVQNQFQLILMYEL